MFEKLAVLLAPRSVIGEAFRTLRANLQTHLQARKKVITITAATPGSGSTTAAVNLALSLVQAGQRVLARPATERAGRLAMLGCRLLSLAIARLRAALARKRPVEEATRRAAAAGQFLAFVMGLYGLITMNVMLVFIAFFVYVGAAQESTAVTTNILTQGVPVRAAMVTEFRTLSHGDTIRDAANLLLATTQQDFPVMHGGRVIGLLARNALLRAMATGGPESYVAGAMNRDFVRLDPDENFVEALRKHPDRRYWIRAVVFQS